MPAPPASAGVPTGLSEAVARERLAQGANEIAPVTTPPFWRLLGHQLIEPLGLILVAAGLVSILVLDDPLEGSIILAIVAVDAVISLTQQVRANGALAALHKLTAPTARVVRDGAVRTLPARELVVEDVFLVAAGDRVPADAVVLEAWALQANEAILTGESLPVAKAAAPPPDERGRLLAGTVIVTGRGVARTTATGAGTKMGAIAGGLGAETPPPLERELRRATARLGVVAVIAAGLMLGVIALRSDDVVSGDALLAAVALAVAAVPESLLAVVTLALALGVKRMAREGTIVRRMKAVEGLGAANVLCVDKTGTLTEGRLRVVRTWSPPGREPDLWAAAQRCNDATIETGDPLEVALLQAARDAQAPPPAGTRVREEPFDAASRRMATVHQLPSGPLLTVKGAPEAILPLIADAATAGETRQLLDEWAEVGLRVLAFADAATDDLGAKQLRLVGLMAFQDTVRPSAARAVAACRAAGIRLVMVTGDHPRTARSIAREVGLDTTHLISGPELAALPADERAAALRKADVIARVEPDVKVDLVRAHQAASGVVAMMGDGVNDAPALTAADIGVAVAGDQGTDVARDAADIVLTSPDLGTLVNGVREGRGLHHAIVEVVSYLLAGNTSEVVVVLAGLLVFPELALPLTAVQLLWVNLVTDGLPALALGADRPLRDPLARHARKRGEPLLSSRRMASIMGRGTMLAALVLTGGVAGAMLGWTDGQVQTQLFLGLVAGHLILAYVSRGQSRTFGAGWWRNRLLLGTIGISLGLQGILMALPWTRHAFGLEPLPAAGWAMVAGVPIALVLVTDTLRWMRDLRSRQAAAPA